MTDETHERPEGAPALAAALARAQGKIEPPTKSKEAKIKTKSGADYSYRYASLDDIIAAIKGPLAENELAWTQDATTTPQAVSVFTRIMHSSGESIGFGPLSMPYAGGAQELGSALTYARRYALTTALGIPVVDDDDAIGASKVEQAGSTADTSGKASAAQMKRLHALAASKGISHEQMRDWAGQNLGIESLTELTKAGAARMGDSLEQLPDRQGEAPGELPDADGGYEG